MSSYFRRAVQLFACFFVLLVVASCSPQQLHNPLGSPSQGPSGLSSSEAQYYAGMNAILENYVAEIPAGTLALVGVNGLAAIDPGFMVHRSHQTALITFTNGTNQQVDLPITKDPVVWARFTDYVVTVARENSPKIAAAHEEQIYEAVFDAYVSVLDEYSRYWNKVQAKALWEQLLGFGGIGITLKFERRGMRVQTVLRNSPAQKAKIRPDDLIVAIDGIPFRTHDNPQNSVKQLRGPVGSVVWVSLERGNGRPLDVKVKRDEVVPETVQGQYLGNTLYLKLSGFNKTTARSVLESLIGPTGARTRGANGIILDVRGNPGGILPSSIAIADMFLNGKSISKTTGRVADSNDDFFTKLPDVTNGLPLVILQDEESASAAEVLAAAIQDNRRGIIIGTTSYGKGSVQSSLPLPNGGRINLTIAEFSGPNGTPLNRYGVTPDICTNRANFQLATALSNGQLSSASKRSRELISAGAKPNQVRKICPPAKSSQDKELAMALTLMSDPALYRKALQLLP